MYNKKNTLSGAFLLFADVLDMFLSDTEDALKEHQQHRKQGFLVRVFHGSLVFRVVELVESGKFKTEICNINLRMRILFTNFAHFYETYFSILYGQQIQSFRN